jgi:undecaprenyl-diphosphatase
VEQLLSRLDSHDRALFMRWAMASPDGWGRRRVWALITHLGSVWCSVPAALVPLLLDGTMHEAGEISTIVLIVSHLLVQLVKRFARRARPSRSSTRQSILADPDRFSFPSGHAAAAMSIALGFSIAMPQLTVLLVSAAIVIGASRVFVALHFPGDVLAGQTLALLTGAVVVALGVTT